MSEPVNNAPRHQYEAFLRQLPADWDHQEITQLGAVVGGGTPSREVPSFWRGPIPWVTPGEVSGEASKLLHDTQEHISPSGLAGSGANLLPAGSLLVTTRATLGARAINAVPMATNQGFKSIVFKKPEEASYYYHLFEKVKPELVRRASGTTFLEISGAEFGSIKLPSPSPEEKLKIAELLDTLDTAIRQSEAIVDKLKQVKQGLLHDLLTRGVDANGELRPSYEQAPELYQDSPLGWVPKAWDVVTLESVSHTVTSGSRDWARFYADSGALFVRIGNLTREHINFRYESTIYVRPPRNADGQRTRLESGDILISITADLGIIGVVPDGMGEAYINQHIALVRPNLSIINPRFVGHYLASPVAQTYISKLNDSGAKAGLNLPTIRSLITAKPIGDEQDVIATRLDEIDKRIQNATTESAKLRELKSGLMDDLLTGRVRVTPLLAQ